MFLIVNTWSKGAIPLSRISVTTPKPPRSPNNNIGLMTKSLGATLREAREAAGLSLRALSKLSGTSPGQISQIECGSRKSPGFPSIARIALSLNLSLDDVACASGIVDDLNVSLPRAGSRHNLAALGELRGIKNEVSDRVDRVVEMLGRQTIGQPATPPQRGKKRPL